MPLQYVYLKTFRGVSTFGPAISFQRCHVGRARPNGSQEWERKTQDTSMSPPQAQPRRLRSSMDTDQKPRMVIEQWSVVSMDNAGFHGKGKACLCQIQDLVWDWPSLWDGFSGISEEQHFVPLLFHMIRAQHHLQTYLKRCKKSEITDCSRRKRVTYGMGYCHCLVCSEYHKVWHEDLRLREGNKEGERGIKNQNQLILCTCQLLCWSFGDKCGCIMPATGSLPHGHPTRGKVSWKYEHQFWSVVFSQVWSLSLRTTIPNAALILPSDQFLFLIF